jgi:hypothetical protein
MADPLTPPITEPDQRQVPPDSVSAPESGTQGSKQFLEQLARAASTGGTTRPQGRPVTRGAGLEMPPRQPAGVPPGIPGVVVAPTDRPQVSVATPLQVPPPAQQLTPEQERLRILDVLATDPRVSEVTRNWARLVRDEILLA